MSMKHVLTTSNPDDVRRVLDQIPYTGAYFTSSASAGTHTDHYTARGVELCRVTRKENSAGETVYTVRLEQ